MTTVAQSAEKVKLEIVNESEIFEKDLLIPLDKLKPLKGTNKVHQVLWKKDYPNLVVFREVSCFICLSGYCHHVKLVGELNYGETCEEAMINKENQIEIKQNVTGMCSESSLNDREDGFLIHRVEPKKMLLRKGLRTDFLDNNQENIKITSNIILKPAQENINVTKLSDLRPDNKLHLTPDRNINKMVSLYNIGGSTNLSGVFENFVNESTLQEALSETEDVDSISSSSVKGTHSNAKLQSKPHSSFWKRYGQNNLDSQSFSASTINKAKRSEVEFEHFKPPLHNNDDLSSSDDDFDIFPTKNSCRRRRLDIPSKPSRFKKRTSIRLTNNGKCSANTTIEPSDQGVGVDRARARGRPDWPVTTPTTPRAANQVPALPPPSNKRRYRCVRSFAV
ncbi:hypothetical protein ACJJTC_002569 [Scirpophaga incertulas]